MFKSILAVAGFVGGFVQGVIVFMMIDYLELAPSAFIGPEIWSEYGMFLFGAVGAVSGAVLGVAAYAITLRWRPKLVSNIPHQGLGSMTDRQART